MNKKQLLNEMTINQKLNLLIMKFDKKAKNLFVSIDEEQIKKVAYNMDLKDIFKKNGNKVNFNVIEYFMGKIIKKITTFSSDIDNAHVLKIKQIKNINEALNSYSNDIHITISNDKKKIINDLEEKYDASKNIEEDFKSGQISDSEYANLISEGNIFPLSLIDEKLGQILNLILPIVKESVKRYEVKKVKRDNEVKGSFLSTKIKLGILFIVTIYYNILAYIVYENRFATRDSYNVTVGLIFAVNIIFLVLLVKNIPSKSKVNENKYLDMIDDFELVVPTTNIVESKRKNAFNNSVDLKELCDGFYAFMVSKGISMELRKVRELFSAMASNRLVFIKNKTFTDVKFLKVLNEFLGNDTYYDILNSDIQSEQELIWVNKHGVATTSEFINGVCEANKHSNNINIAALIDVDIEKANLYLGNIFNFVKNPNEKGSIRIDMVNDAPISQYMTNGKLPIPKNMWFLLFLSDDSSVTLPKKIVEDSILIEIEVKDVEKKELTKPHNVLSYVNFSDSITRAREENFISDELWDKLDDLEDQLKQKYGYTIENGTVRKMEIYASVYNVCSQDENASLDSTIANVLLSYIFTKNFVDSDTAKNVLSILNNVFDDNIIITKEVLNKYN